MFTLPPHDCKVEPNMLKQIVVIELPERHKKLAKEVKDYASTVRCSHCGKILKYAYTKRSNIPGFDWET